MNDSTSQPDVSGVRKATDAVVHDPSRLQALDETGLLDSPPEIAFDRITDLVARLLDVPISLISLVDIDRQFFKSAYGLPDPAATERQTPLSYSFCQYVVGTGEPLIVEDARVTPLVQDNLAVRDLNVVAYLGIPIVTPSGQTIGSLCAIDGKPRAWSNDDVSVLREVAELAMTELELRHANRMLEARVEDRTRELHQALGAMQQLNEELQHFAEAASHDLQEPLRKVALLVSVIEQDYAAALDGQAQSHLDRIRHSAQHMLRMLRDLLQYAQIATNGDAFAPIPLASLVGDIVDDFRPHLEDLGARLDVEALPSVQGNAAQLRVLFRHLFANALRYTRPGVVPQVRVTVTTTDDRCRVTVEDNGKGFDGKYAARVLQPFERLAQDGDSAGMGLAICQRIASRHGGTLVLDSTPGEGTRVHVTLPLAT